MENKIKIDKKKVLRKRKEKTLRLNLRITIPQSKWMKDNSISPQAILDEGLKQLMVIKK